MARRGRLSSIVHLAMALAALALPATAGAQPSENSVKTAFLPKFARYVQWQPSARPAAGAPLTLCLIGVDPFGPLLDAAVAGQTVDQSPVLVRRLSGLGGVKGCHLAFVRGETAADTARLLLGLRGLPVLTITDARTAGPRGMIHFALRSGRVGFHVDDAQAARSGLTISSRLLSLALSVKQRQP